MITSLYQSLPKIVRPSILSILFYVAIYSSTILPHRRRSILRHAYLPVFDHSYDYNFVFQSDFRYILWLRETNKRVYVNHNTTLYLLADDTTACVRPERLISVTETQFATARDSGDVWFQLLHPPDVNVSCWAVLSHLYRSRTVSEGWQDGVLEHIFSYIKPTNRFCVEFGYPSERGSNTANLKLNHGFYGVLWDSANQTSPKKNLTTEFIRSDNIVQLFTKYQVPSEVDYVSIDIDSTDLWVFRVLVSKDSGYRPRVVSVEYNENFPIASTVTCFDTCRFLSCRLFGTSIGALALVAQESGYSIVAVVSGLDVFFVRNDILQAQDIAVPDIGKHYGLLTGRPYLRRCSQKYPEFGAKYVTDFAIDYRTWRSSGGNITLARSAAASQLAVLKVEL